MGQTTTRVSDITVSVMRPATPTVKPPVLLVHGMFGGAWHFEGYQRLLAERGYESHALNLRGHHGSRPVANIGKVALADYIADAAEVARVLRSPDGRGPIVIGYSMGGLIAAYLVKCLDQGRCVRRVVTIGTPHRGVPALSEWWWLLARWARSAHQMRAGSAFLDQLLRMPAPEGTSILSVAGSEDTIVPPDAAHLEGAGLRNLVVPGLDHWTLPKSRRVFRCVKEVLQSERGQLPPPQLATQPMEMAR